MAVKKDIANVVAEKHELTKKEANEIMDTVVDTMQDFLGEGEGIQLTGFGSFGVRERAARKGRNPQTGEELHIPAKFVPTFKAGKYLREVVEALGTEDNQDHHHHG